MNIKISKETKNAKENVYGKWCLECNKMFIGVGKGWFGLCDECKKKIKEE